MQLSERDRLIIELIKRGRGNPTDVAAALDLSYSAATKAIQRATERMAQILTDPALPRAKPAGVHKA